MRSFPVVLIAVALAAFAPLAAAQKGKPRPAAGAPGVSFTMTPAFAQKLRSGDEAQVRAALDDVRMAGRGAQSAAPIVAEVLQRGLSLPLTEAAIDTLGDVEAEGSSPALAWYVLHRSVAVRRAAVKALLKTRGPASVKALRMALRDSDAMVRGVAATGLGSLKAKDAVNDLLLALDRRIPEAAASIGQLCTGADCDQLAAKLGRLPFDIVTGGLEQILFRPSAEVSDDDKVKVVSKLRELGTQEANRFLKDVQGRWPPGGSPRVKAAIDQGVLATTGGSQ